MLRKGEGLALSVGTMPLTGVDLCEMEGWIPSRGLSGGAGAVSFSAEILLCSAPLLMPTTSSPDDPSSLQSLHSLFTEIKSKNQVPNTVKVSYSEMQVKQRNLKTYKHLSPLPDGHHLCNLATSKCPAHATLQSTAGNL